MSQTLAQVRTRVRYHLNDLDPSKVQFTTPVINKAIGMCRVMVAGAVNMPDTWSDADFTTDATTDTYNLSGTTQVTQLISILCPDTGIELVPISRAEFQGLKWGLHVPPNQKSQPRFYVPNEDTATHVQVQLYPWPDKAYRYNVLRAVHSADPGHTDSSSLAFDEHGIEALAARAAEYLAGKADPAVLAALHLSPQSVSMFAKVAEQCESDARVRNRRLSAVGKSRHARRW